MRGNERGRSGALAANESARGRASCSITQRQLLTLYQRLLDAYGEQHWWPGESRFEVLVGAVLTQNTAWTNVKMAIAVLRDAGALQADAINALPVRRLAALIRSSGTFNIKAVRLHNLCRWFTGGGGFPGLEPLSTAQLRGELLAINGIGPETADVILLYAFGRPVFVIDAYTRRLLLALRLITGDEGYETLRALFESRLPPDPALFNQYHALIVRHGKERRAAARNHCRIEAPL